MGRYIMLTVFRLRDGRDETIRRYPSHKNLYHILGGDDDLAMDLHGPLGYVVTEQIVSMPSPKDSLALDQVRGRRMQFTFSFEVLIE